MEFSVLKFILYLFSAMNINLFTPHLYYFYYLFYIIEKIHFHQRKNANYLHHCIKTRTKQRVGW